jgi:raffinose/stachyose/melibiose transport system substrate-binding protein
MPLTRRAMMKAVGLGSAALAAPGLVAGCSSAGGCTSIVLEETKPEVIPYFDNLVAKFNASQRSISVTHDSTSSLIAEFVRGDPPDIDCDNYNPDHVHLRRPGRAGQPGHGHLPGRGHPAGEPRP